MNPGIYQRRKSYRQFCNLTHLHSPAYILCLKLHTASCTWVIPNFFETWNKLNWDIIKYRLFGLYPSIKFKAGSYKAAGMESRCLFFPTSILMQASSSDNVRWCCVVRSIVASPLCLVRLYFSSFEDCVRRGSCSVSRGVAVVGTVA